MKRFIAVLLILMLSLSSGFSAVYAEETEGEVAVLTEKVHFDIDFEDYASTDTAFPKADETHGYGYWQNRMTSAGEIIKSEDGNALKITKNAASGMYNRYTFNEAVTKGKMLLSFDMRYNVNGTVDKRDTWMFFNGSSYVYTIALEKSSDKPAVGAIGTSSSTVETLFDASKNDKMYHVDVLFDIDAKTKMYFVDGNHKKTVNYSDTNLPSVSLSGIKFNLNSNIAAIDNFKLVENPKNYTFSVGNTTTEEQEIIVKFSDPVETPAVTAFKVTDAENNEVAIESVSKINSNAFKLVTVNELQAGEYTVTLTNDSYASYFGTTPKNTSAKFEVKSAMTYFEVDFEGIGNSTIPNYLSGNYSSNGEWALDGGAELYTTNTNGFGDASKGIYATDIQGATTARRNIGYTMNTPVTEGKITISFDMALDSTINKDRMQMLYINNDANNGNLLTYGMGTGETADSTVIAGTKADLHYSGGTKLTYEDNKAYRFDTVIDLDNDTVTNYCDGVAFNTVTLTDTIAETHKTVSSVCLRLTPSVVFLDNYKISYNTSGFGMSATDIPTTSSETYIDFGDTIASENVALTFTDANGNTVTPASVTKISPRRFSVIFDEIGEGVHTVTATAGMKSAVGTVLKNNSATFSVAERPTIPMEYVEYAMVGEEAKTFDFEGAVAKPQQYTDADGVTKVTYNDTTWKVSGGPDGGHVFALTTNKIPAKSGDYCVELRSTNDTTMCAFYANKFWMGKQGEEVCGHIWLYWPSTTATQYFYVEIASYTDGQDEILAKSAKYYATSDIPKDTWVKVPINSISGATLDGALQVKIRYYGIEPIYVDDLSVGSIKSYPNEYYIVDAAHTEENGVVTATATAKKRNYWYDEDVTVFGAAYDKNDVLVGAKVFKVLAKNDETPLTFTANTENLKVVKWFTVDSVNGIRPLGESTKDYKPSFKILSHNVGKYSHGAGAGVPTNTIDEATDVYLDFLNEVNADIFCAQEHAHYFDDDETVTATEQVFGKYYDYNFKSSYNKNYVYQGQAIYSKLPIVDTGMGDLATDLEGRDQSQRGYTKVVINIDGKDVAIFNSHFSLGGVDFRNPSREVLIEEMNKYEYSILCMDANSSYKEWQQFLDAGYVLGNGNNGEFTTTTLKDDDLRNTEDRHFVGSNCIDQILISPTLEFVSFDVIFNSVYSDHMPLVAEIAFK